jgi:hypothetical protein
MSIDDTSYFDSSNESYQDDYQNQGEQDNAAPAPTSPNVEQLLGAIQSLKTEIGTLKANPLASLGYQPIQQPSSQYDPASLKEAQEFLKAQGVMTKDSYTEMAANETREEAAINNGFQNSQHLAANFWGEYYSANNPQVKAELESLLNLYESGSRVNIQKAVQGFKSFNERKQQNSQPLQNQTFGRVPQQQNTQSQSSGGWPFGKTNGPQEYNSWRRTADPQMVRQLEQKWMSGQIPDPF